MTPEETRLRLLSNGYTPIRNRDKRTFMQGWPTAEVDEAMVKSWSRRNKRDTATGLRVENGLAVIDIDVNAGKDVADAIAVAIQQVVPETADALLRLGKGTKEAWFLRCEETFSRIHSRRFTAPGQTNDDGTHVVECFGGLVARQFGAYGPHTVDDDGNVAVWYRWDGDGPAEVPIVDLPVLSKSQFHLVVDTVEAELLRLGFEPVAKSSKGESDAHRVYDLTADMSFDLADGRCLSLHELSEAAAAEEGLRCSASWLEGPDPKRSPDRCIIGTTRTGNLTVWDSASGVTHCEADKAPRDFEIEMDRVAEKLRELGAKADNKLRVNDGVAVAALKLTELYAFCPPQPQKAVVPIYASNIADGVTLSSFRTQMQPYSEVEIGPRGGRKTINPVDIWASSERRVTVEGLQMRPDQPRPTFEERGKLFVNTFDPPVHDEAPAGVEVWRAFMEHLLPDPVERDWFFDWLAHKFRFPAVPGPGVIMVSRKQGAGRGTLFAIVSSLFGSYSRKVDGVTLTGEGGQSQYNTWLASSVLVLIDELFSAGTGAHLWQRKKAYDRIKSLIDPASREVEIIQKTLNNYVTKTFTSFLMATNNLNALPLEEDDRRICVLTNGRLMGEVPDLGEAMDRYRVGSTFTPAFVAAVAADLRERDISGFNAYTTPPMFKGKINMIHQNTTEVAEVVDECLAEMPGDFVTRNAFIERVKVKMGEAAREQKHLVPEARSRIDMSDWVFLGRVKVKDNGSKADVWARNAVAAKRWEDTPWAERGALLEPNEDPRRKATDTQMKALAQRLTVVKGDAE